jgi:hypothetical protein
MFDHIMQLNFPSIFGDDQHGLPTTCLGGDYTPSKARTPIYVQPNSMKIPFGTMDIHEIARRVDAFVQHNRGSLLNYVDPGYTKSVYLMENGMLYKNHLILHHNMNSMVFVHIEVFLSQSSQEYIVEINRTRGTNDIYKYFYNGIKQAILTGTIEPKTVLEQEMEETGFMKRVASSMSSYLSQSNDDLGASIAPEVENV